MTFSFKYDRKTGETNINQCNKLAKRGVSIAVVDSVWDKFLEGKVNYCNIIDGDRHDFRWMDYVKEDLINVVILSEKK